MERIKIGDRVVYKEPPYWGPGVVVDIDAREGVAVILGPRGDVRTYAALEKLERAHETPAMEQGRELHNALEEHYRALKPERP
jgi:hypothetical protein